MCIRDSIKSLTSSLLSAATRFRRQIATGSSSANLPLLQAGSQGLSQVLPKTPGKTLESQLIIYASEYFPSAISLMSVSYTHLDVYKRQIKA